MVMTATLVTSEPVPAVVGMRTSGRRGPVAWSMPYMSASFCGPPSMRATTLAVSIGTAAAKADHRFCAKGFAFFHRFEEDAFRRVCDHLVIDMDRIAILLQPVEGSVQKPQSHHALVGDDQQAFLHPSGPGLHDGRAALPRPARRRYGERVRYRYRSPYRLRAGRGSAARPSCSPARP